AAPVLRSVPAGRALPPARWQRESARRLTPASGVATVEAHAVSTHGASMFAERRTRLLDARAQRAAICASAREARRHGRVGFELRQDSAFYYLTGVEEPDSIAVLRPGHDEPFVLFVRPHDPEMAVWVGPRAGIEGAVERFGAGAAYPIDEFEERLP